MALTKRVPAAFWTVVLAFAFIVPRASAQLTVPQVWVTNPPTHPVLTSRIDDPGRIPYQSTQNPTCEGANCTFTFTSVPVGRRLVIQHVSGILGFSGSGTQVSLIMRGGGPDAVSFLEPYFDSRTEAEFDKTVQFYVDAGQAPIVYAFTPESNFAFVQSLTLIGYELDCTASPCAEIAH
jgi:hypothetical protein